jgi:hypothetical protein
MDPTQFKSWTPQSRYKLYLYMGLTVVSLK